MVILTKEEEYFENCFDDSYNIDDFVDDLTRIIKKIPGVTKDGGIPINENIPAEKVNGYFSEKRKYSEEEIEKFLSQEEQEYESLRKGEKTDFVWKYLPADAKEFYEKSFENKEICDEVIDESLYYFYPDSVWESLFLKKSDIL